MMKGTDTCGSRLSYQGAAGQWVVVEEEERATRTSRKTACCVLLALIPLLLFAAMLACTLWPAVCPRPLHTASTSVMNTMENTANVTGHLATAAWNKGMALLQDAVSSTAGLSNKTSLFLRGLWEKLRHLLSQPFSLLSSIGQNLYSLTVRLVTNAWSGVTSLLAGAWNTVTGGTWNSMTSLVTWPLDVIWRVVGNTWAGVIGVVRAASDVLTSLTSGVWDGVSSLFTSMAVKLRDSINSLAAGIRNLASWAVYQLPSSCYAGLQFAAHLVTSPLISVWNFTGDALVFGKDLLLASVGWLWEGVMYPLNLSLGGLQWAGHHVSQGGQNIYSWGWQAGQLVTGFPTLLMKGVNVVWQGVQTWLLSPLSTLPRMAFNVLNWFQSHLSSLWSWFMSCMTSATDYVPSPYHLVGSVAGVPGYVSQLLSAAWHKTQAFIFRPKYTPGPSSDLDIGALVDKIIENRRFQEALVTLVRASQAGHQEGGALLAKYSKLESDLDAKFESQLSGAREELVSLVRSLTEEQARDMEALAESQSVREKRLEELLLSVREQEALVKEKTDQLVRLQAESAQAAQQETERLRLEVESLRDHLTLLETEVSELMAGLPSCCKHSADIEAAVTVVLGDLLAGRGHAQLSDQLAAWLGGLFVSRSELEEHLQSVKTPAAEGAKSQEMWVARITDRIRAELSRNASQAAGGTAVTHEEVLRIVQAALVQYDADKTGLFDYALETAGGSVVSTRCTETYVQKTALYSIFGIPVWYPSNNPRTIIQPGVQPGQCWAFKGSAGYVVIQLSEPVQPTRFSLEHIAQSMSPSGRIDSAPRDFVVYGLRAEKDPEPFQLGSYSYSQEGGRLPLQFFSVEFPTEEFFPYIELDINSNHGNVNYTCLYRFRVHGNPHPSTT